MNMSSSAERSKKQLIDNVVSAGEPTSAANLSPSKTSAGKAAADKQVTDKQVTDKQVTDKQVNDKQVTDKLLPGAPATPLDAPMHAAKGNDDIMSEPQASQLAKKKS